MEPRVELLWIPLGAGGAPVVSWSGRAYERLVACRQRRPARALHHCALRITVDDVATVVEVAPAWDRVRADRGVVATGPVGSRLLGRSVWFRYEVRVWRDGVVPDELFATVLDVPTDPVRAGALREAADRVPAPVWGRDEQRLGEMWNSNSVVAWLLTTSGHEVRLPDDGRAPGWSAGVRLAARGPQWEP